MGTKVSSKKNWFGLGLHTVYIGSSHYSVRLMIGDTTLKFSAIIYYN